MMVETTVPCVACCEPIAPTAEICTKCRSTQSWTRHVLTYTTLVSALLGLVPVVTIALSLYEIAFGQKQPDIRAQVLDCAAEQIDISVMNAGDAAGVIRAMAFSATGALPNAVTIRRKTDAEQPYYISETGSSAILTYEPYVSGARSRFPRPDGSATGCTYHLALSYVSLDGVDEVEELSCACAT